MSEILNV
jgi:ankyrin repeat protein